ncbi:MAG: hypothetical protein JWQ98_1328 [Chlorobi bacterium]|nr:hypothetical protein [Chlorobiota bacterium]
MSSYLKESNTALILSAPGILRPCSSVRCITLFTRSRSLPMNISTILKLAFIQIVLAMLACSACTTSALAQFNCTPDACSQYTIAYHSVFETAASPIICAVYFAGGDVSYTSAFSDGSYTYPESIVGGSAWGICINNQWIPIPAIGPRYYITDPGLPAGLCLEVEIHCTPCLRIEITVHPCQPNPPDIQNQLWHNCP